MECLISLNFFCNCANSSGHGDRFAHDSAILAGENGTAVLDLKVLHFSSDACGSYQDQWCAPAQSQESPRGDSTGEAGRYYRTERLRESLRSPLIRFMPKDNGVTSKAFRLMRGNFSTRWRSRMSILSKAFRRRSRLSSAAPAPIHDRPSRRRRKFTITCACFFRPSANRTIR